MLQDGRVIVTIMPRHLQPSRQQVQRQLQQTLSGASKPSIAARAAAAGWIPLPGLTPQQRLPPHAAPANAASQAATAPAAAALQLEQPRQPPALSIDTGEEAEATSPSATVAAAAPGQPPLSLHHLHQPSSGMMKGAAAASQSVPAAAALPMSLPGSPSDVAASTVERLSCADHQPWRGAAAVGQTQGAAASASAGHPLPGAPHVTACNPAIGSASSLSRPTYLQTSAVKQHGTAADTGRGDWACHACGVGDMTESEAWLHYKVSKCWCCQ